MLQLDGIRLHPRLIILDKDGTLIAFGRLWHAWFARFMGRISERVPLDLQTRVALAGTLGYDPVDGDWDPLGPLTLASTGEIVLLAASQLYSYQGLTWDEALDVVRDAEEAARATLADDSLIEPIGDVRGTLQRLVEAGYLLAVATTDLRAPTVRHLERLGAAEFVSAVLCGDDGVPLKPAPDMALALCRQMGVLPEDAIMVGDSVADMTMARLAGLGGAIAVSSGAVPGDLLAEHADCVIPDLHAIRVLKGESADA
jgi:phosphoglycolate phosphatase